MHGQKKSNEESIRAAILLLLKADSMHVMILNFNLILSII
jgi:copper(I)-binding protein